MSTTNMSVKVGGRIFEPALPVVDDSPPTEHEVSFSACLQAYTDEHIPLESSFGLETRERVLAQLKDISNEWIQSTYQKKRLKESSGGQLFTSGSYRLGVHEPGADIDCILVAPSHCTRDDFFGNQVIDEEDPTKRDPESLAERIKRHPDVTNFVPVEGAAVPILTFDFEGINIDLLFARINSTTVPKDFDINNDAVLDGVDSVTEKSLNGPRVTNLIAALVGGTPQRYQTFLKVVRCIRKWAKARGLYSNKMGYWGGVNINIGVALVVQLYPNAAPASLLRKFFLVFKTWRWPQPILLTKIHDAGYGLTVWSREGSLRQVAPMITPAYPSMNSTLAISRQTLQILQEEFNRGHEIVDRLWKSFQKDQSAPLDWKRLFEPSDFFISYPNYLSLCIVGPSQSEAQAWAAFVESRLRKLVSDMLARNLPLRKIQLWPKKVEACVADRSALLTQAQRENSITYFVGFHVDKKRMRGDQLNVEIALSNFRDWDLSRFQPLLPGMDILVKIFRLKELPQICFEGMYDGGKDEAMKKRRHMLENDPMRQEKKRLARLEELKAKMEEMKRKKESEASKKRARVDSEVDELEKEMREQQRKMEEAEDDVSDEEEDENVLDTVLDNMADPNDAKTKAEAEEEKKKLLSGALLEEGDVEYESDDEAMGYTGEGAQNFYDRITKRKKKRIDDGHKDPRSLPPTKEAADFLKKTGFLVVGDDEMEVLGNNFVPPWRGTAASEPPSATVAPAKVTIQFLAKPDIVELDSSGLIIDKGDDDFMPSKNWIGRKPAFEFKLGERGLGYYRTGKPVKVPSNTAY